MFDKLVTGALRSPSLVGELGAYHQQLTKNKKKRGMLVLLSGLFLLLQYVGLFHNLNTVSNANLSDTIYGGFSSRQDILVEYDSGNSVFRQAADALSISRAELEKTTDNGDAGWINNKSSLVVAWSHSPIYKAINETAKPTYNSSFLALSKNNDFRYYGHIEGNNRLDMPSDGILSGHSSQAGDFAILKNSGNFLTSNFNADTCYKQPQDNLSYLNCPNSNSIKTETTIKNLDYKTGAEFIKNHPGDPLQYNLKLTNQSSGQINLQPELYVGDILEYAKLTDIGNAQLDNKNQILHWPKTTVGTGVSKTYTLTVQILDKTPLSPQGASNGTSYDCQISSFFGGTKNISLVCPTPKIIERMLALPPEQSFIALAWLGFVINILLYTRTNILTKESGLILKNIRRKHD